MAFLSKPPVSSTPSEPTTDGARSPSPDAGYVIFEGRQEELEHLEAARSAHEAMLSLNRQSADGDQNEVFTRALLRNILGILSAAANRAESLLHWLYPPFASMNLIQSNHDSLCSALSLLMDALGHHENRVENIAVDQPLMRSIQYLLMDENYTNIPSQVGNENDVEKLIGFFLHLFDRNMLSGTNPDLKPRARRLILELSTVMERIPSVLYLTPSELELKDQFAITYGRFVDVYLGTYRGVNIALKRIRNFGFDKELCRDALAWRTVSHKHVIPFLGIYLDQSKSFTALASLFMVNGTLSDWRKKGAQNVSEIQNRIYEVAEGLRYLHHEGIIYGDLCGANVLLDGNYHVRIADFGIRRHSEETMTIFSALSFQYTAPESFPGEGKEEEPPNRTKATDVYAFACLYYEIFFGILPFSGKNLYYISTNVKKGIRPERLYDPALTDREWELIEWCWHQDPARRPGMGEVVQTMRSVIPRLHDMA